MNYIHRFPFYHDMLKWWDVKLMISRCCLSCWSKCFVLCHFRPQMTTKWLSEVLRCPRYNLSSRSLKILFFNRLDILWCLHLKRDWQILHNDVKPTVHGEATDTLPIGSKQVNQMYRIHPNTWIYPPGSKHIPSQNTFESMIFLLAVSRDMFSFLGIVPRSKRLTSKKKFLMLRPNQIQPLFLAQKMCVFPSHGAEENFIFCCVFGRWKQAENHGLL